MSARTRLLPEEPLPPYTYVPGRSPHPVSDPAGHSFGVARAAVPPIDPAQWEQSAAYLRGLDLFNHGYYWEAHEQLEGLWLAAGRKGPLADFLKGLIKLAAAGVKHLEGKSAGVRSHGGRAAELFAGAASEHVYLGLSLADLIRLAETVGTQGWPSTAPVLLPTPLPESGPLPSL